MSTPSDTPLGEPVRRLYPAARWVLIAWAVFSVGMGVIALVETRRGEGFDDLARFIGLFMAGASLVIVGLLALLIRHFVTNPTSQTLTAIFAPPVLGALALLLIRLIG